MNHISTITKRSLNRLTGSRQVSIQEAVHEIAGLDLVICSDYLTDVSLGRALYLRKDNSESKQEKDLISAYRSRPQSEEHMTLENYFYEIFSKTKFYAGSITKRQKHRILIPKGLNCRPRYPVDYDYAKGMLVMHKPWSARNPLTDLLNDEEATVKTFLQMVENNEMPYYVTSELHRAIQYSQQWQYECVSKGVEVNNEINLADLDNEELADHIHWEHSRHLSAQNTQKHDDLVGEQRVNVGLDHDWTLTSFKGKRSNDVMPPEEYTSYLKDVFYGDKSHVDDKTLLIPTKKDGTEYQLDELNQEQQMVVICALESMIKFLSNDPSYKPLRATVVGCGGTGKSHIVNTLISMVRKYTKRNDTVRVAAPSGGAAYNVGGCTLHRCLNLAVEKDQLAKSLNADKQADLARTIENMLMLIIDERSMISSSLLAAAERNVRECAFGQQNKNELWGGIPVVLIFGDDYQLFPVIEEGAIKGYAKQQGLWDQTETKKPPQQQLLINIGNELFINDLTQDVFNLTTNYRSRADPQYAGILERLRIGESTDKDADRLMKQGLHHHRTCNAAWVEQIEKDPATIFLYTQNFEKNVKNREKLVQLSRTDNTPVARLQCKWKTNKNQGQGRTRVFKSHFTTKRMVLETDLCVGATVALSGINIVPEAGLYNGARGTLIDFIYDNPCGPNDKHGDHLPGCVIVDFPGLKLGAAEPWDKLNPTVSKSVHGFIFQKKGSVVFFISFQFQTRLNRFFF